jgi:hypothetical protein
MIDASPEPGKGLVETSDASTAKKAVDAVFAGIEATKKGEEVGQGRSTAGGITQTATDR